MTEYANFRQRLDLVLRTLDVKQVSEFLIAEKQWQQGTPADVEFAMWMMIAGSPTLKDLHSRAREWMQTHGHEEEANAIQEKEKKAKHGPQAKGGSSRPTQSGSQGGKPRHAGPQKKQSSAPSSNRHRKNQ